MYSMKRSRMKVETVREVKQDPRSEIIRFDLCESYEKVITVLDYNGVCDLEWFSVHGKEFPTLIFIAGNQ